MLSLQKEKDMFVDKLQNGNIQTPNFDRYVSLLLGDVQRVTRILDAEKLKSMMYAHKLIVNKVDIIEGSKL